jgi:hypothetical protein
MQKREKFNAMRKCECDAKKQKHSHRIAFFFKNNGKKHRSIALSQFRIALPALVTTTNSHLFALLCRFGLQ